MLLAVQENQTHQEWLGGLLALGCLQDRGSSLRVDVPFESLGQREPDGPGASAIGYKSTNG
jgi:hypothetical protein